MASVQERERNSAVGGQPIANPLSEPCDKVADIHADVAGNGAEESGRDVSTLVEGDRGHAAIWMWILAV
jgi:hypothetical protein